MYQSKSKLMSGLGSVKRDFSSNNNTTPSSSQTTTSETSTAIQKKLSASEQRLKDIQDALSGKVVAGEKVHRGPTTLSRNPTQTLPQKRANDNDANTAPPPVIKRRQLPSSWADEPKVVSEYKYSSLNSKALSSAAVINDAPKKTENPKATGGGAKGSIGGVFLSQEQTHILKLVESGESVFYTGSAGTGKSVLLREIIKVLRRRWSKSQDAVAITASTGIAACNIGGVTIHSFSGVGIGEDDVNTLVTRIRKNKKAMARWLRTRVLIIDEVSMLDGDLFDKLAEIGVHLRKDSKPFGGIQIIVTGDFFQLPPVNKGSRIVKFAFDANYWPQAVKQTFNLTKVFRQKDQEFVNMLNEMRFGKLSQRSIQRFRSLSRPLQYDDGVSATELFPRREDVERSNSTRMNNMQTETHTYTSTEGGVLAGTDQGAKLLQNFMAPGKLILKVGAQVMLIKNMDETLVNGSMGTIVEFIDPAFYLQNPDDPYVLTKSDESKPPSKGAQAKDGKSKKSGSGIIWPVVEFLSPKRRVLIQPETWKVELPNGEVQVSRTQLPLIPAWAMSIHKSQGQTLERVKVDLAKVFEKGQAYVALSRATSLEGLQVLNFDPAKVNAHPRVVEWSKTLQTIES